MLYGAALEQPNWNNAGITDVTKRFYKEWLLPGYNDSHFDGGNLLFFDGHVKWRKPSTICPKKYSLDATACGYAASATSSANALF